MNGTRTLHSKICAFGGKVGGIGSANIDNRSARSNSEALAIFYNDEFTRKIEAQIEKDIEALASEIRLDDVKRAPLLKEIKQYAKNHIAELF